MTFWLMFLFWLAGTAFGIGVVLCAIEARKDERRDEANLR